MDNWQIVEDKIINIIDILSRRGMGGGAKSLQEQLNICHKIDSIHNEQFQEAAEALYQLLTHTRGVSDIYVEEFTLSEWVNILFDAAKHVEPFIEKRNSIKKNRNRPRPRHSHIKPK